MEDFVEDVHGLTYRYRRAELMEVEDCFVGHEDELSSSAIKGCVFWGYE
jgi:hypothetical protein